jgi:two-component system sensor histidine kinase YesM
MAFHRKPRRPIVPVWAHLRSEVFVLIMVACVLQALIIGFVTWRIDTRRLFESEKENLTQLLNVVNEDLESRVDSVNSIALDVVISAELKANLNGGTPLEVGRAKTAVNSILSMKVISASRSLLDLSIIDLANNTYSTRATYLLPPSFRLQDSDVFAAAAETNGALVWMGGNSIIDRYGGDSIFPSDRMGGLRAAAVIKEYTRGSVLGLLMVSVKDDFFSGIDYSNSALERVGMYMVSPDGATVYPVAGSSGSLDGGIIARIDAAATRDSFVMSDAARTLVSYIHNDAMAWTLVSTAATAAINRSFSFIIKTLVATLVFALAASMLVSWLSTNLIAHGIGDLAEKMRLVEQGNFDVQINSMRRDEIGWLSRVFDRMVRRVEELIDRTYKQQLLTQQAELRALQAQINPHFLYNTLDMISWRLLAAGQGDISASVVGLGRILHYSLSAQAVVSLEQEIRNIEDYLSLRKSNKDPDFTYTIEVEGGRNVHLLKLTLQPFVENSILHGFSRRRSGNALAVRAHPGQDGRYHIRITDNGVGMDKETLDSMLVPAPAPQGDGVGERMHIGIRNVDERLRHLYGPAYALVISSEFGSGTTVDITVPETGPNAPGAEAAS